MNVFIGVGRICNIDLKGRILKFNLAIKQEKPCRVPCVIFDPDEGIKKTMEQFEKSKTIVWLHGRASTYEFEFHGKIVKKFEIMVYAYSIRPI